MLPGMSSRIASSVAADDGLLVGAAPLATQLRLLAAGSSRSRSRVDVPLQRLQARLERFVVVGLHIPDMIAIA